MRNSAGIIPFRIVDGKYEFFVGHPGGPFWAKKEYWALLKGGIEKGEDDKTAAIREFAEESGFILPEDVLSRIVRIGTVKQNPKKNVTAFAVKYGEIDPSKCHSNLVEDKGWPEIDRYEWMEYSKLITCTNNSNVCFYKDIIELDSKGAFAC